MYNVKLYSEFTMPKNASSSDKAFLPELKRIRDEADAAFVNFSLYRNQFKQVETCHFLTYPFDWLAHYLKSGYSETDPLLKFDYRNVSMLEWEDMIHNEEAAQIFEDFHQRGLGNHGVIVSNQIDLYVHGVSSFSFRMSDDDWHKGRVQRLEKLRFLSKSLCNAYERVFFDRPIAEYNITARERECLYWVAIGKTDEEIGQLLDIGKWTVVSHLKSAKYKLDSSNRSAAVAKALALGIIQINIHQNK